MKDYKFRRSLLISGLVNFKEFYFHSPRENFRASHFFFSFFFYQRHLHNAMVNDQLPTIKNSFVNLRKRKYKLRYVCNEHVWSCIIDCQSISYGNLFLPSPKCAVCSATFRRCLGNLSTWRAVQGNRSVGRRQAAKRGLLGADGHVCSLAPLLARATHAPPPPLMAPPPAGRRCFHLALLPETGIGRDDAMDDGRDDKRSFL